MKRCTRCYFVRDESRFSPHTRAPDGTVLTRHPWCKPCRNELARRRGRPRLERPTTWRPPARKTCAVCGYSKAWEHFTPRLRWSDGSARSVYAYCRQCGAKRKPQTNRDAYLRRYARENAERERERKTRWAAERRRDQLAQHERKVDLIVERLEAGGAQVDRRVSAAGRTLRLTVTAPGRDPRVVIVSGRRDVSVGA